MLWLLWIPSGIVFIIWVVFVGVGSARRSRDVTGWVILAIILSPLVATMGLLLLGENPKPKAKGPSHAAALHDLASQIKRGPNK